MYENQEKKRARAINAAVGKASTGTHQIAIEFEFLDEAGGITYYGPLSEAAFEYTMKAIRTAGFVGDDFADLSSLCDGQAPEVVLVIGPEEYNGKVTRKVKFINSAGGLAMKDALQGNDLEAFARKMKGKVAAYDRSAGSVKAAPRSPPRNGVAKSDGPPLEELEKQAGGAPGYGSDDDIPFGPFGNV
jgi:hypothetical protein